MCVRLAAFFLLLPLPHRIMRASMTFGERERRQMAPETRSEIA